MADIHLKALQEKLITAEMARKDAQATLKQVKVKLSELIRDAQNLSRYIDDQIKND